MEYLKIKIFLIINPDLVILILKKLYRVIVNLYMIKISSLIKIKVISKIKLNTIIFSKNYNIKINKKMIDI